MSKIYQKFKGKSWIIKGNADLEKQKKCSLKMKVKNKFSIKELLDQPKILKLSSKVASVYLSTSIENNKMKQKNVKNIQIQEENISHPKKMKLCYELKNPSTCTLKIRKKKSKIKEKMLPKYKTKNLYRSASKSVILKPSSRNKVLVLKTEEIQGEMNSEILQIDKSKKGFQVKNHKKKPISVPSYSNKVIDLKTPEIQKETDFETLQIVASEMGLQIENQQKTVINSSDIRESLVAEEVSKVGTSNAEIFKLFSFGKSQVLVCLKPSESFSFYGCISVQVIYGCLNVLGCNLIPDGTFHPVYSPSSHSFLSLTAQSSSLEAFNITEIINKLKKLYKPQKRFSVIEENIVPGSVIFLLSKLRSTMCYFVDHHCHKELFPKNISSEFYCERKQIGLLKKIQCSLVTDKHFVISNIYQNTVANLCDIVQIKDTDIRQVFVVCGVQNIGKSSFIRYFINSLLERIKSVQYLECDVGQSEFTPPGCISLVTVTKPLLGPSFTHLQKPDRMCFYGDVAPFDVDHYVNCLKFIIDKIGNEVSSIPLIVNTMGYSRKTKYLLISTLSLVQPSYVIQLRNDSTDSVEMPKLTSSLVSRFASKLHEKHRMIPHYIGKSRVKYKLSVIFSPVIYNELRLQFRPFELREFLLLSYLSQLQPENFCHPVPVNMLPMHVTPWKNVALHVCSFPMRMSDILRVINASWVALCQTNCQEMIYHPEMPDLPKFLKDTPVCECFGFGIVRNIDIEKKLLLILTPLPEEELQKVNCLLKGNIDIPVGVLENQLNYTIEEHLPYISKSKPKLS